MEEDVRPGNWTVSCMSVLKGVEKGSAKACKDERRTKKAV